MDYLIDTYIKNPDYIKELLNKKVTISLKIDGSAFQIFYNKNEDKIEYHKRGGSSSKLGPIIDEYTQLFTKHLNDAIDYFKDKQDLLKENKFYAIEIFNDMYILLTVIDNNDNVITDVDKIAKKLNIESLPILLNNEILSEDNKENLISLMTLDENTSNNEFIKLLKDIFGPGNYEKFLNGDEIEGIVLTWVENNKPLQFKIINPAFKTKHKEKQDKAKEEALKDTEKLNELIECIYDKLKTVVKHRDNNWIKNLDLNFLEMISDEKWVNKVKSIAKEITPNTNKWFMLQMDRINKDIKSFLDKHGNEMKTVYEKYLMSFNKPKKRAFIISKEFQTKINGTIERMMNECLSLRQYIQEHLMK